MVWGINLFKINRNSIFFSLGLVFVFAIFVIVLSFFILLYTNNKNEELNLNKKYHPIVRMVLRECHRDDKINDELREELKHLNLQVIQEKNVIDEVLHNSNTKVILQSNRFIKINVLEFNGHYYIDILTEHSRFLLQDSSPIKSSAYIMFIIFIIILIAFVLVFLATIKKLYPIKILHNKVKHLGDEEFDFVYSKDNKKDEISLLAKEFSQSARKLKEIKEARNVFIRNIMHELKTPITKGKFLTELPCTEENESLMKKVFYRLESLINEFASIEEVISKKEISKKEYFIEDLVDNALDLLLGEEDSTTLEISNEKILVNFKLFSIAIKNLIDNAIKYSELKHVKIVANSDEIKVINNGEPLKFELEYYFEPFGKEHSSNSGFGLGLYITNHIIKVHGFELFYSHKNGENIFCIHMK